MDFLLKLKGQQCGHQILMIALFQELAMVKLPNSEIDNLASLGNFVEF